MYALAEPGRVRLGTDFFALVSLGNKKGGPSFSLQNISTCPYATALCKQSCYVNYGFFQRPVNIAKRDHRTTWVMKNLTNGVFAGAMIVEIQRLKLKTLRIHDSGDFFSPTYVRQWMTICKGCPNTTFWFYTRSFAGDKLAQALRELAALPNVHGWLSLDLENVGLGMLEFMAHADSWRGVSLMQTPGREGDALVEGVLSLIKGRDVVIFPEHLPRRHTPWTQGRPNCPAITGALGDYDYKTPACVKCTKCLRGRS